MNSNSGSEASGDYRVRYQSLHQVPTYSGLHATAEVTYAGHPVKFVSNGERSLWQTEAKKDGVVSVFDVARYVLHLYKEAITTMKLHKLLYYCQAWHLVWEEKPLFSQNIEAWANGPVVRELFNFHKGMFSMSYSELGLGNEDNLTTQQKEDVDSVIKFYGDRSAQWLIEQSHSEMPWIEARRGLAPLERGERVISLESMQQYYSSL